MDVVVPKMGMSSTEVDLVTWLVAVGDQVTEGTPLAEVATEKVTATVDAPAAGTVSEILVSAGEVAQVGDVICRLA